MIERRKKLIWYCERILENEEGYDPNVQTFKHPVKRYINLRDMRGEAILMVGGELDTRRLIAKKVTGDYRETSRCYIHKPLPETFDEMCQDADYEIRSILTTYAVTEVIFERLIDN